MSLLHFFISFEGRISRQAFWLGFIVLVACDILAAVLLERDLLTAAEPRGPGLALTIWGVLTAWPAAAVSAKRFKDRNRPAWLGYALLIMLIVQVIANHNGLMIDPAKMEPFERTVFSGFLFFFLFTLIDNGVFRGTVGPNRYGPDPLEGEQAG